MLMGPDFFQLIPEEKDKAKRGVKLAKIKDNMIFPLTDYDSYEGNVVST